MPDQFEIFHGSGGKDDSLDDLYLENYSNTEFVSEEDVHEFLSHVSELLETFHDGVGFEFSAGAGSRKRCRRRSVEPVVYLQSDVGNEKNTKKRENRSTTELLRELCNVLGAGL